MKHIPSYLTLLIVVLAGCSLDEGPAKVTQTEYGESWPFTVPEGVIDCIPHPEGGVGGDVVLRVGKTVYAVNGAARGKVETSGLYKDLTEIWRDQPARNEGKVPIPNKLMQQGFKICDARNRR